MTSVFAAKIEQGLAAIRSRPENERRAMFVASFLVSGALIFSVWAGHMRREFGVAFRGPEQTAVAPAPSQRAGAEKSEQLPGPLTTLKENMRVIKEEASDLLAVLSSNIDYAKLFAETETPAAREQTKLPPIAADDVQAGKPAQSEVAIRVETRAEPKIARAVSIIKYNVASLRRAFSDFYEYLTR